MANSVTFPEALGGNGQTYTDDADPDTGLDGLGYTVRFIPCLQQAVVMGQSAQSNAEAAAGFVQQCQTLRQEVAVDRVHVGQQRAAVDAAWYNIRSAYYGPLHEDPTVDPNGNPPEDGDRYYNTVEGFEKSYNGSAWQANEVGAHLAAPDPHPQYEFRVMHNTTATRVPTTTDDSAAGYAARSTWFDTSQTPPEAYRCIDATGGAAKWVKTSLTLDELGSAALASTGDFDPAGSASQAVADHKAATDPHSQYAKSADLGTAASKNISALVPAAFHKLNGAAPAWTAPTATTLETASALTLVVGSALVSIAAGTAITLPALAAGTDYTIYAATDGSMEAVDADSLAPAGTRKVGGFHARAGDGNINQRSCWDLNWRPSANPRGMTLSLDSQTWVDIYFCDVDYALNGYSRNGKTIADGGSPPKIPTVYGGDGTANYTRGSWWAFNDVFSSVGKRFPTVEEFPAFGYGVVEHQSATSDPVTTKYQAGYRSSCGVEQATGNMHTWGGDASGLATSSSGWQGVTEGRGNILTDWIRMPILGGRWGDGINAGSRASHWVEWPNTPSSVIAGRAVCDHVNLRGG